MASAAPGPEWMLNRSCKSRYIWHPHNSDLQVSGSNQAARITLAKRQARGKNTRVEPELYACKWYSIAGRRQAGSARSSISGLKYVQREVAHFASANHPNIVRFRDFSYELGGAQWMKLYMDYCGKGDLNQFITSPDMHSNVRLSCNEGIQVLIQLSHALLYLHHGIFKAGDVLKLAKLDLSFLMVEDGSRSMASAFKELQTAQVKQEWRPITHRDVKPGNVFVTERKDGKITVKLGDFGLAKLETDGTDSYVGTRDYLAPERPSIQFCTRMHTKHLLTLKQEQRSASPNQRTTFKSDIYALGLTVQRITWLDDSTEASATEQYVQQLLGRCLETEDSARLSSVQILDALTAYGRAGIRSGDMRLAAVNKILDMNIDGTTNRRKKLSHELGELIILCRRLLEAGADPNAQASLQRSMLHLLVRFSNHQLEVFEGTQTPKRLACPFWKMASIQELIRLLKSKGAQGTESQYDIGLCSYKAFHSASKARRHEILLAMIEPKINVIRAQTRPAILEMLANASTFQQLLKYTVDEQALAAEVKRLERSVKESNALANATHSGQPRDEMLLFLTSCVLIRYVWRYIALLLSTACHIGEQIVRFRQAFSLRRISLVLLSLLSLGIFAQSSSIRSIMSKLGEHQLRYWGYQAETSMDPLPPSLQSFGPTFGWSGFEQTAEELLDRMVAKRQAMESKTLYWKIDQDDWYPETQYRPMTGVNLEPAAPEYTGRLIFGRGLLAECD